MQSAFCIPNITRNARPAGWECHHVRAKTRMNANRSIIQLFKCVCQPSATLFVFHVFNSTFQPMAGKVFINRLASQAGSHVQRTTTPGLCFTFVLPTLVANEISCPVVIFILYAWFTLYLTRGVSARVAEDKQNGTSTSPGYLDNHS